MEKLKTVFLRSIEGRRTKNKKQCIKISGLDDARTP